MEKLMSNFLFNRIPSYLKEKITFYLYPTYNEFYAQILDLSEDMTYYGDLSKYGEEDYDSDDELCAEKWNFICKGIFSRRNYPGKFWNVLLIINDIHESEFREKTGNPFLKSVYESCIASGEIIKESDFQNDNYCHILSIGLQNQLLSGKLSNFMKRVIYQVLIREWSDLGNLSINASNVW